MNPEFLAGCRYLAELNPMAYQFAEMRFWSESQLAEALALEAMREDTAEVSR